MSAIIFALVLFGLTGCMPEEYDFTPEEEAAFLEKAESVISDYLENQYSGAEVMEIHSETRVSDGNVHSLTPFAGGQFNWRKQTYNFVVNTETEAIYTSVYLEEITRRLQEVLLQGFGINAQEVVTDNYSIYYLQGSSTRLASNDVFENIFPEGQTVEELLQNILQNANEYSFSMRVQYKGEMLPSEIMEQESPFPTLSFLSIYHIAEEHALCREEYSFSILPSLSEEILWLNFRKDTASYTRNHVLEQDGFQVVYNACERTKEEGVITQYTITDEDIALTVTKEYIALDCAKDNYVMYLSVADQKTVKKYLYAYSTTFREIQKGMWYAYEDRYVYANSVYVEVPHEFTNRHPEENIIYTKSASKKQ